MLGGFVEFPVHVRHYLEPQLAHQTSGLLLNCLFGRCQIDGEHGDMMTRFSCTHFSVPNLIRWIKEIECFAWAAFKISRGPFLYPTMLPRNL